MKKYIAEFFGTLVLVLFGTGVAVISGGNIIATSLAFGLAIVADAYVIGNISGCHVNPAVSFAMILNNKMNKKEFIYYVISQVFGALSGTLILYLILNGTNIGIDNLGANGFDNLSVTNTSMISAFITEVILTFVFIFTILGVTKDESKKNISGIVIGLTLSFVHLFGINLTGTSVNPARSLAPAIIQGGDYLSQVWLFILAPLLGAFLSVLLFRYIEENKKG